MMDEETWSPREQAHFSAEQPAPRQDARLPAAHAHPGRACHYRGSAAEGPGKAECLILPRPCRMRRSAEFRIAMRAGTRAGRRNLVGFLVTDPARAGDPPRVGFTVGKAVGPAVVRNRVRRRLRELMRGYLQSLPGGSLFVVRANPPAARASQADLAADLALVMRKLLRQQ